MAVCSLQLAAVHSLILEAIRINNAIELITKPLTINDLYDEPSHFRTKKALEIANKLIPTLVDKIPNVHLLPMSLKARLTVIACDLSSNLINFLKDLIEHVLDKNESDIALCAANICVSQNFEINRKKSILTVLEKSKLAIQFEADFLMDECIEKHFIEKIVKKLLNVEARRRKTRRNDKAFKEMKKRIICSLNRYHGSTIKQYLDNIFNIQEYRFPWMSISTYLTSNVKMMKYYCSTLDQVEKKQLAYEALDLMLEEFTELNPDIIMYLVDFIDDTEWAKLVEEYSMRLIEFFLPSWRYRHLCVEWFKRAIRNYDLKDFRTLVSRHLPFNKSWGDFEIYEFKCILKNIWLATPQKFKEDFVIISSIEQFVISIWGDHELYFFMIKDFDLEKQKEILSMTALIALDSHEDIVPKIMNRIRELGFEFKTNNQVVSLPTVIGYICRRTIGCKDLNYQQLLDKIMHFYFDGDNLYTAAFKDYFTGSCELIELLLRSRWSSEVLIEIIKWLHNGSTVRCKRFVAEMLSSGVIQDVYEKIIVETGNTKMANEGIENLFIHQNKHDAIRRALLKKSNVRKAIMIEHFSKKKFNLVSFEFEWEVLLKEYENEYGDSENKSDFESPDNDTMSTSSSLDWSDVTDCERYRQIFFEELLVSEECIEALVHMLVHVNKEKDEMKYLGLCDHYYAINSSLFQEYRLSFKIDKLLERYGHPNDRNVLYYRGKEASERNLPLVRKVVDFSYRSFRAILRGASQWAGNGNYNDPIDLTKISIAKANAANLFVPVTI